MKNTRFKSTGDENLDGKEIKMPIARRRSVSIDEFVEENISVLRASAIIKGLTYDFTTLINAFAEYGLRKALENPADALFKGVLSKYLNYDELQECGLMDEWKDFQEFKEFKRKQKKQK